MLLFRGVTGRAISSFVVNKPRLPTIFAVALIFLSACASVPGPGTGAMGPDEKARASADVSDPRVKFLWTLLLGFEGVVNGTGIITPDGHYVVIPTSERAKVPSAYAAEEYLTVFDLRTGERVTKINIRDDVGGGGHNRTSTPFITPDGDVAVFAGYRPPWKKEDIIPYRFCIKKFSVPQFESLGEVCTEGDSLKYFSHVKDARPSKDGSLMFVKGSFHDGTRENYGDAIYVLDVATAKILSKMDTLENQQASEIGDYIILDNHKVLGLSLSEDEQKAQAFLWNIKNNAYKTTALERATCGQVRNILKYVGIIPIDTDNEGRLAWFYTTVKTQFPPCFRYKYSVFITKEPFRDLTTFSLREQKDKSLLAYGNNIRKTPYPRGQFFGEDYYAQSVVGPTGESPSLDISFTKIFKRDASGRFQLVTTLKGGVMATHATDDGYALIVTQRLEYNSLVYRVFRFDMED